ncbi:hypothetical protein L3Q82_025815 [Scortum barcoo]|uniref:Uncharacterized protein n=1 Tax=Scortum barcoo TaxID=214431 RepID=A0ACB8WM67_9TELE|nr:hypothetical protein L3Q82_025815 [Scortum barcoo]
MSANGSSEAGCRSEVRSSNSTCSQKELSVTASAISMTVGILSNSLALFILVKSYSRIRIKSKASFLLFASSLVVTDLLGHLINGSLVLFVYSSHREWETFDPHRIMCSVFGVCMVFFGLSPLLLGSAMAVERCIGVTRPIFHSTALASHHMKRLLGLTLLLAALVAVLPVLLWRPYKARLRRKHHCRGTSYHIEMICQLMAIMLVSCVCWGPLLIRVIILSTRANDEPVSFNLLMVVRMATWNQILDPWVYILLRKAVLRKIFTLFHSYWGPRSHHLYRWHRSMLRSSVETSNLGSGPAECPCNGDNMNQEKLAKLQAQVRIGGKGSARRKKKVVHRTATADDKKLQSSLKKLAVNNIAGIEEVNMIKDDGTVIHFNNPKVQASLSANTFAITGHAETKQLTEMLPGILSQLGADSLSSLRKLAEQFPRQALDSKAPKAEDIEEEDDDVPEIEIEMLSIDDIIMLPIPPFETDEGDNPSLQDTKHHWLNRPCLLVLKDGDVSKTGLGCGQIRPESPSKTSSDAPVRSSFGPCEQKLFQHLDKTASPSQLEEGSCTVTSISTWGESCFGESSTPLVLSPAEAAWPEAVEEELAEEKRLTQPLPSKEDSVIEEKEVEESRLEQQEQSCSSEATPEPSARSPEETYGRGSRNLQGQFKMVRPDGGDEIDGSKAQEASGEGATGDCAASPMDPDNEIHSSPVGILSKERGSALGEVAPVWVPDAQAQVCMKCGVKFTFTKRRHHCRACGKVFCALCSSLKFRLTHLDGKEGRVCISCHSTLIKRTPPRGKRRVWFADEILNKQSESAPTTPEACGPYGWGTTALVSSSVNLIPLDGLPPILTSTGVKGDYTVEEQPSEMLLIQELESGRPKPLVFVLNANLLAMVKLVNYVNRKCWCVTTKGMHAVGQVEVVVLLQCLPEEKSFPKDIFSHFIQLYRDTLTGKVVKHLSLSLFGNSFLGSEEHAGFLYIRSTLQSLQGLPLPNQPYLFGLLVHRAEVAWAKAFPLRLMLRLGAEYRCKPGPVYPCPLYSTRFRKPLFGEIGHTIMRLLVDFRNYRYSLPMVPGLTVDLEAQRTLIKIPTTGYNELMKALNKSNEHVLAIGACFNETADSHLICVQGDDGYQTQAISIHSQPRKVTGSCFFIFSSALKASAGYLAKSSIVEDGLMVQITVETMAELRRSLREMKDYTVTCGRLDQSDSQELVCVQWVEEKCTVNKGVISPIDGKSMESISSIKMFQKSEYKENGKIIRWTEVFFLQKGDHPKGGASDSAEHNRLTERIARAFCLALCPHLKLLKEDGMAKLGLRVAFESQEVGFVAGSNGQPLPAQYLNALDSVLIPVIHSRGRKRGDEPIVMELIFYILENIT